MSWGLITSWAKPESVKELRNGTLNPKAETILEKSSFWASIINKRCLILDGYIVEWSHLGNEKFSIKFG